MSFLPACIHSEKHCILVIEHVSGLIGFYRIQHICQILWKLLLTNYGSRASHVPRFLCFSCGQIHLSRSIFHFPLLKWLLKKLFEYQCLQILDVLHSVAFWFSLRISCFKILNGFVSFILSCFIRLFWTVSKGEFSISSYTIVSFV